MVELLPVKPSIKQWLDLVQANSEAKLLMIWTLELTMNMKRLQVRLMATEVLKGAAAIRAGPKDGCVRLMTQVIIPRTIFSKRNSKKSQNVNFKWVKIAKPIDQKLVAAYEITKYITSIS